MRMRRGVALSCLGTSHNGGEAGESAVLSGPTSCKRGRRSLAQALDLPTGCTSSVQIDLFQLSPKAAKNPYFLTTDVTLSPQPIVEGYTPRWSLETTCQECRAYLKWASTKCYRQQTVLRLIPCVFGLYTLVVVLYLPLPQSLQAPGVVCWRGKSTVTFSDRLSCVRWTVWQPWFFHTHHDGNGFSQLSPARPATLLDALAPAA
jgi:hypothetical protein